MILMCGIAGFVGFEDRRLLRKMCDIIEHRGPDSKGFYFGKNIGIGARRLSIIDRKGGNQPIHNEDETVWTVFNGEIYNYMQLRKEMESKGHKFYTKSDTEVLVHLYEEYGDSFVKKLRGMFAFAIWDTRKKKLLLARDRMGKKPLYYHHHNGRFYFASEIKSILTDKRIPRSADKTALSEFLTFRASVGENTMFKGIMRLMPGHIMTLSGGKLSKKKYWGLKMTEGRESESYYIDLLRRTLEEAVKMRLVGEVPLGAYLSGGVDSSTVVAIMKKFSEEPVKTFSIGFGNEMDETGYARQVAEALDTDHREFMVKQDTIKLLPDIVWHFDEPVADPAAIPTYILSEHAKKDVTVVMTGEGADEIFAGYFQYKVVNLLRSPIKRHAASLVNIVPKSVLNRAFEYTSSLGDKGMERFQNVLRSEDHRKRYLEIVSIFDDMEKKELIGPSNVSYIAKFPRQDSLNSMLIFDVRTELHGDLLMKVDKMTMAHSIEARAPFMDSEVVELAAAMPANLKLRGMKDKYLLRKMSAELLPKNIVKRKKHNFFLPLNEWNLKDIADSIITKQNMEKIGLNHLYIDKIMNGMDRSKLYYSRQLWSLINLELWRRIYIEDQSARKIEKLL